MEIGVWLALIAAIAAFIVFGVIRPVRQEAEHEARRATMACGIRDFLNQSVTGAAAVRLECLAEECGLIHEVSGLVFNRTQEEAWSHPRKFAIRDPRRPKGISSSVAEILIYWSAPKSGAPRMFVRLCDLSGLVVVEWWKPLFDPADPFDVVEKHIKSNYSRFAPVSMID